MKTNIKNFLNIIIAAAVFSNFALGQTKSEKPQIAAAVKKIEKCDTQILLKESEILKNESVLKLKSFDSKTKNVKNKIIQDGVSTNIFLNKLLASQEVCKNNATEKKWIQTEIDKNTIQLKSHINLYCKDVLMPTRTATVQANSDQASAADAKSDCKNNVERRTVNFIFDACTPGTSDYDLKVCECHIKDKGNACLAEKAVGMKLLKKIDAVAPQICDEKTPQSTSSFFDTKNLGSILALGVLLLALGIFAKKVIKTYKKQKANNAETQAASPGGDAGSASSPNKQTAGGKGCYGSYKGRVSMPEKEARIKSRNLSLQRRNIAVTGNDAVDNANAGGGPPDGGIWMAGSFEWETDGNCKVISGHTMIFDEHRFEITGTVGADRKFSLSYLGPIVGWINADNTIGGQLQHGGGEEYVHGVLSGTFTPKK